MEQDEAEIIKKYESEKIQKLIEHIAGTNEVCLDKKDPLAVLLIAMEHITAEFNQQIACDITEEVSRLKKELRESMSEAKNEWYEQVNACAQTTVTEIASHAVEGVVKNLIIAQQQAFTSEHAKGLTDSVTGTVRKYIKQCAAACWTAAAMAAATLIMLIIR